MTRRRGWTIALCGLLLVTLLWTACDEESDEDDKQAAAGDDDADNADDDAGNDDDSDDALWDIFEQYDFLNYVDFQYTRSEPGVQDYTNFYFSTDDCRCFDGREAHVSISWGAANKVMLFLEGGGATWPGGGFAVDLDYPGDIGFKNRDPLNPLADWSFVYVPYCDHSIHSGDRALDYDGLVRWHWGQRHTGAAVSLMKQFFPNPEKILVAGSSAGGYGTFLGWAIVKSQYMDTPIYVLNDSGTGFWDPDEPEMWAFIRESWNVTIPDECVLCTTGTAVTYLYQIFMDLDPQLRVGMFSSYRDWIISTGFLGMEQDDFQDELLTITNEIYAAHPDRFKRFLVKGETHTTYEFLLPGGPKYEINGTSMYTWIDQLVNDDPAWSDLLE